MGGHAADFIAGVFLVALLFVLVRPGSKGADLVTGFGNAMQAIVAAATDLA